MTSLPGQSDNPSPIPAPEAGRHDHLHAGRSAPLRFQRPSFPASHSIERYFAVARSRAWYSNGGPCLEEFSRRLQARSLAGVVPLANATLALILGVAAVRREGRGNKVLMPSFTFPAVVEAVIWNGLEPVYLDVSGDHLHLDPVRLGEALSGCAREICLVIAASSFGTPPPSAVRHAWEDTCREADVGLLIDSAAGFSAIADDRLPVGSQGDAEVVSFHITKPFGIGEGGALFSRHADIVETVRSLANFGFDSEHSISRSSGLNAKLDELRAAVGLAVLDEIDVRISARRASAGEILGAIGADYRPQLGHELGTYQFVTVLAPTAARRARILRASEGRVELRTYYQPLHQLPAFSRYDCVGGLAVTEQVAGRVLSLPMFDDMSEQERLEICEIVLGA